MPNVYVLHNETYAKTWVDLIYGKKKVMKYKVGTYECEVISKSSDK